MADVAAVLLKAKQVTEGTTDGPWFDANCCTVGAGAGTNWEEIAHPENCLNVPFIAASRELVPQLAELLEQKMNELERYKAVLDKIEKIQPQAIEVLRKHDFVFDGLGYKRSIVEWEKLAFTFYSDICYADSLIKGAKKYD